VPNPALKLPRNGTPLANCLLLAGGILVGYGAGHWRSFQRLDPESQTVAAVPSRRLPPVPLGALPAAPDPQNPKKSAKDAAPVLSAAARLPEAARLETLRGFYGDWSVTDPAGAAAHALQHLKPGSSLSESLTAIARTWGTADARTAWQWAEDAISGPLKTQLQTAILQGWSGRDPAAAGEWLSGSGLTSQPFYDAVAANWAAINPAAAVDWAKKIPDSHSRSTAEVGTAREIASRDPGMAADLFSPIISPPRSADSGTNSNAAAPSTPEPNSESLNLATAIADLWATTDPAAAAKWVSSLPAGPGRDEASATLATVWGASDIHAATAWSAQITDPDMRRQVIEHLGTTWGAIEPDKALAWLGTLPPAEAAPGMEGALHSWAATDPRGLGNWLTNAGSSALTGTARLALGDVLTDTNLPQAMDLAMGIAAGAQRDSAISRFYHAWRKTDPDSALEWRNAQWPTLPESTRQHLTNEEIRTVTVH